MQLNNLEVLNLHASGGMAEVYRARIVGADGVEQQFAVKKILPAYTRDKDILRMFVEEARIAAMLHHECVARVFDLCTSETGEYFIVMEFADGKDLSDVIWEASQKRQVLPLGMAVQAARDVLRALDHAWNVVDDRGVQLKLIHRDVSPHNVLVTWDGRVKLTDFGIAKVAASAHKTQMGVIKGKFGYMSPEQARGRPLDQRSDLFAVGILMFEAFTGERLFDGPSDPEILEAMRAAVVPRLPAELQIPTGLEAVMRKALEKDPERRFASAAAFLEALTRAAAEAGVQIRQSENARTMKRLFPELAVEPVVQGTLRLDLRSQLWRAPVLAAAQHAVVEPGSESSSQRRPAIKAGGAVRSLDDPPSSSIPRPAPPPPPPLVSAPRPPAPPAPPVLAVAPLPPPSPTPLAPAPLPPPPPRVAPAPLPSTYTPAPLPPPPPAPWAGPAMATPAYAPAPLPPAPPAPAYAPAPLPPAPPAPTHAPAPLPPPMYAPTHAPAPLPPAPPAPTYAPAPLPPAPAPTYAPAPLPPSPAAPTYAPPPPPVLAPAMAAPPPPPSLGPPAPATPPPPAPMASPQPQLAPAAFGAEGAFAKPAEARAVIVGAPAAPVVRPARWRAAVAEWAPRPLLAAGVAVVALGLGVVGAAGVAMVARHEPTTSRTVVVRSTPPGASVWIDGVKLVQQTPLVADVDLPDGAHTLRVGLAAGAPAERAFTLTAADRQLVLSENLQSGASLRIDTQPTGARVLVDGVLAGRTPVTVPASAGRHIVQVRKTGFRTKTVAVPAERPEQAVVNLTLDAEQKQGQLVVQSTLPAQLELDGAPWGTTSSTERACGVGRHQVRVHVPALGIERVVTVDVPERGVARYFVPL